MEETKWVHPFAPGRNKGGAPDGALLGRKGANLAELCALGLPVPPGFTVTSAACNRFLLAGGQFPSGLEDQISKALAGLADATGKRFGDAESPLLVSVRVGPRVAVPGLMPAILNLGLNDAIAEGLALRCGDPRFAWSSFRRFITAYGEVVLGLDEEGFDAIFDEAAARLGHGSDEDFSAEELRRVVGLFKSHVEDETGDPFPDDPGEQLRGALAAAFNSWTSSRPAAFRSLHDIPDDWGAAASVQAMVFGNLDEKSAAGTAVSRDPATGKKVLSGRFLPHAQGDELSEGSRTPAGLTRPRRNAAGAADLAFQELMPDAFNALEGVAETVERHFREVGELDFTVERGKLWLLQTRAAHLTTPAALRAAVGMADEGLITRQEAVLRIDPAGLEQLLHPSVAPDAARDVIASGLPASPGAATGAIAFSPGAAAEAKAQGHQVILVRIETSPEDIAGMQAAAGILTVRGGMTSHAAVLARGMGKPCVSGAGSLRVDARARTLVAGGRTLRAGDTVTIDGSSGQVLAGAVALRRPNLSGDLAMLLGWADAYRRLGVRANAETVADARIAHLFGAEGIGLCRTEHMFFDDKRLLAVREMILADTAEGRSAALAKLVPMQRADFAELFRVMAGLPVTIRLLDPPLHEFLPREDEIEAAAVAMGVPAERLRERAEALREANPMLGHRGCRLLISYPEIAEAQARAIFEAAAIAAEKSGAAIVPEIMVPLVGMKREIDFVRARIDAAAKQVAAEQGAAVPYLVGTMIELPRAALRAAEIAQTAEFFSFGTNDLTQTTFGISRDDAGIFLDAYRRQGIVEQDPFAALDRTGVGELMELAVERGRRGRQTLKLGICGEHAGEPAGIEFCEQLGLDYISCSPFRVPIARLAAAQAAIRRKRTIAAPFPVAPA